MARLVADFETLPCQVTTTFYAGCEARICTEPAINYSTYDKSLFLAVIFHPAIVFINAIIVPIPILESTLLLTYSIALPP